METSSRAERPREGSADPAEARRQARRQARRRPTLALVQHARRLAPWSTLLVILLPSAVWLASPAPSWAQRPLREGLGFEDHGPIRVRDQFVLGIGFLQPEPESADLLAAGDWQIDIVQSVTNNWAQSEAVEAVLDDRIQLTLSVPVMKFDGGIGDAPIQETHEAFGIDPTGRDGVPRDDFTLYIRSADGDEHFVGSAPSAGLGDVTTSLKVRLTPADKDWFLALEGVAKLPTGEEEKLYGSGELDFGAQLLSTLFFHRSCLHLGVGAVRTGGSELLGVGEQSVLNLFVGYERRLAEQLSWIVQATFSESPLAELDIPSLTEDQFLLDMGLKWGLGRHNTFFVAMSENYRNFGSSPDVGLHFGFTTMVR